MKKSGYTLFLAGVLAVIAGLAVPARSFARDSQTHHRGYRSEERDHRYGSRHRGTCRPRYGYRCPHGHKGYEHCRPYEPSPGHPVIYRERSWRWNYRPWGQPGWGSFCFWTPSWGFGESYW